MSYNLVISISSDELSILDDIRELAYGELHGVQSPDQEMDVDAKLTSKEASFIRTLRSEGGFDILSVHDSEPVSAQKAGLTKNGIGCIQKFRFT